MTHRAVRYRNGAENMTHGAVRDKNGAENMTQRAVRESVNYRTVRDRNRI